MLKCQADIQTLLGDWLTKSFAEEVLHNVQKRHYKLFLLMFVLENPLKWVLFLKILTFQAMALALKPGLYLEKKEILYEGFFDLQIDSLKKEEKKMTYLVS